MSLVLRCTQSCASRPPRRTAAPRSARHHITAPRLIHDPAHCAVGLVRPVDPHNDAAHGAPLACAARASAAVPVTCRDHERGRRREGRWSRRHGAGRPTSAHDLRPAPPRDPRARAGLRVVRMTVPVVARRRCRASPAPRPAGHPPGAPDDPPGTGAPPRPAGAGLDMKRRAAHRPRPGHRSCCAETNGRVDARRAVSGRRCPTRRPARPRRWCARAGRRRCCGAPCRTGRHRP